MGSTNAFLINLLASLEHGEMQVKQYMAWE